MSPAMILPLALLLVRGGSAMPRLQLQDAAGKTLCPYSLQRDVIENRTPRTIYKVECHGKDVLQEDIVYSDGHYNRTCRCTEILSQITVSHHHPNGLVKTSELHYPVGCACVNVAATPGWKVLPDTVER